MEPGTGYYFPPYMARVVTRDGILSFRVIKIQDNNSWGVRRGGQSTNIFYRGNINDRWKRIKSMAVSFGGKELS